MATSDANVIILDEADDDDGFLYHNLWPTQPVTFDNSLLKQVGSGETYQEDRWQIMKMKMTTVGHVWKIENFRKRLRCGTTFQSDKFYMLPDSNCSFVLELQHKDAENRQLNWMELSLNMRKNDNTAAGLVEILFVFGACIIDVNGEQFKRVKEDNKMLHVLNCDTRFVIRNFVRRQEIFDESKGVLDSNGVLTLICSITFKPATMTNVDMFFADSDPVPEILSFEDVGHNGPKWKNRSTLFSDVVLQVGSDEFPTHRVILAEHSTVFSAMFEHNMKEKEARRVVIEDFTKEVVDDMLTYIYTGRVPNIKQLALELLAIADKYNITGLKTICLRKLAANIFTPKDALVCYKLARMYNSRSLTNIALYFISRNLTNVIFSDSWDTMSSEHPELVNETLEAVVGLFSALSDEPLLTNSSSRVVAESLTRKQLS